MSMLHFRHLFEQEQFNGNWDGGIVEYSVNGGATWLNASPLYAAGMAYNGILSASGNPSAALGSYTIRP